MIVAVCALLLVNAALTALVWPALSRQYLCAPAPGAALAGVLRSLSGPLAAVPAATFGAVASALAYLAHSETASRALAVLLACVVASIGSVLAAIDVAVRKLPTLLVRLLALEVAFVCLASVAWRFAGSHQTEGFESLLPFVAALAGAAIWFLPLLAGSRKRSVGRGDLRLAPVLGAGLGCCSLWHAAVGLAIALAAASAFALPVAMKGGKAARLALGPFLVAGACLALVLPVSG